MRLVEAHALKCNVERFSHEAMDAVAAEQEPCGDETLPLEFVFHADLNMSICWHESLGGLPIADADTVKSSQVCQKNLLQHRLRNGVAVGKSVRRDEPLCLDERESKRRIEMDSERDRGQMRLQRFKQSQAMNEPQELIVHDHGQ